MPKLTKFQKKLKLENKIASGLISLGGYGVIISIVLIFFFLIMETLPLFYGTSLSEVLTIKMGKQKVVFIGIDGYKELTYQISEKGLVSYYNISKKETVGKDSISIYKDELIVFAKSNLRRDEISVTTNKGRILNFKVNLEPEYVENKRVINPSIEMGKSFLVSEKVVKITNFAFDKNEDGVKFWAWTDENKSAFIKIYDFEEEEEYIYDASEDLAGLKISAIAVNAETEMLFFADENGELFQYDISDYEEPTLSEHWKASNSKITALSFLIGGNSLVVANSEGNTDVWFEARNKDDILKFEKTHTFKKHTSEVNMIIPSPRNRTFLTVDESGNIHVNFSTSSETEYEFNFDKRKIEAIAFSPTSDMILLSDSDYSLGIFRIQSEHPDVSINSLFGKVWYEGYSKPEFVWQSTGGSDSFESKFSLIPLIFGTLKGTLYAMLFSIPIALLGAIYVSQFAPKKLAVFVKPIIEIMAALPSVVIGFLAGLYFSPLFEKHLMMIFLLSIVAPILFIFIISLWGLIPENKRRIISNTKELIFIFVAMLFIFVFLNYISHSLENMFFDSNIKQWLYSTLNITYDQRNSLVVGLALGFAVIPIIFTITEDALSNVPESLTSASLALGASKWQTVQRVVLPAAAGGIFAAIILGLGRAIGETMIVLMATGNTPIMDFSIFNGFRAMSATIAVEIPEAPVGSSLYRVLFLTALLLLVFTFIINSLATYVGDKLRKKYARY